MKVNQNAITMNQNLINSQVVAVFATNFLKIDEPRATNRLGKKLKSMKVFYKLATNWNTAGCRCPNDQNATGRLCRETNALCTTNSGLRNAKKKLVALFDSHALYTEPILFTTMEHGGM